LANQEIPALVSSISAGRVVGIIDARQISTNVRRFSKLYEGVGSTLPSKDSLTSPEPKGFLDLDEAHGAKLKDGELKINVTFVTPIQ
jgi:hypothetical protein